MHNTRVFSKSYLFLFLLVLFKVFFDWYIIYYLGNFSALETNFFILEIVGINFYLPYLFYVLVDLIILLLIFVLGKFFFSDSTGLIMAFLYAINPWSSYMVLGKSVYLVSLVFLLSFFLFLRKFILTRNFREILFLLILSVLLAAGNFYFLFLLPAFLLLVIWLMKSGGQKMVGKLFFLIIFIVFLFFPVLFFNKVGFANIIKKEVSIFSNIGSINYVNEYRGIVIKAGFASWSRFVENKYFYYLRYLLFNLLKNIAPATYFTGQEKMLGFSVNPPLFLGLLPPFLIGIWQVVQKKRSVLLKLVLLTLLWIVPSVLSYPSPDLNKLFIIFPFLLFLSAEGLLFLLAEKKNFEARFLLFLLVLMVLTQMIAVFYDISTREPIRMMM